MIEEEAGFLAAQWADMKIESTVANQDNIIGGQCAAADHRFSLIWAEAFDVGSGGVAEADNAGVREPLFEERFKEIDPMMECDAGPLADELVAELVDDEA